MSSRSRRSSIANSGRIVIRTPQAESFWRRPNETTRATSVANTHPSGAERLQALEGTIAEIRAKQKAKKPLEPDAVWR